ncbi:hypothetical protein Agabi119p4_5628 [Agaricus bisporus var. burnettii]|uniref:F-box domain-containing protein n=1 Tax=Agaricus bisporus var. burnettii TaxID=192524 RepID=A0A8H7F1Z5_AGABI|nr:hypothetical protein Agabi119p4_5628 [Agaricus bisporus var. burnettii]
MNFSALFLDILALIWQAIAVAIRILRWLISRYFEAQKAKAVAPPPEPQIPVKPSFQNMPLQLQTQVLTHLHWKEVLRVRRTCKSWNRATKTREIWADFVTRFTSFQNRNPAPEEPVEAYSAEELERWLLSRLSVELGWRNEEQEPTRYRPIKCATPAAFHLVEGGRWLLVPDAEGIGRVSVYDLDKKNPSMAHLIEPMHKLDANRTLLMAVDIARSAKTLTFNLLLTTNVMRDASSHPAHVRVYKVRLKGHGSNAHLDATHLTTFSIPGVGKFSSIDISGELFARARRTKEGTFLEVLKWQESTSITQTRVRIPVDQAIEAVRIIETNRLAAFSKTDMFIYPIPPFQIIQANALDVYDVVPPLWKLPCPGGRLYRGGLSPVYFDPSFQMTRFVLCAQDGIYGISIPQDRKAKPRLSKLVEFETTTESGYSLGLTKAFFRHRDSSSTTVSYMWVEDEVRRNREFRLRASVAIRERGYPGQWDADPPVIDEASGRIVQFTKTGLIVLDTGLCYDTRSSWW